MKYNKISEVGYPKSGDVVLAFGINEHGYPRVYRALYAAKHKVVSFDDDDLWGATEYSEEHDEFYLKEGFYEFNDFDDVHWKIHTEITHWAEIELP